jgi:hypothetical protein
MDAEYVEIEATRGASLPHRDLDPVMRLFAHYFEPATLMLEQFLKLDEKAAIGKGLPRSKVLERRYFLMFWLAGLYVVMEGIETLPLGAVLATRPLDIPDIAERIPPLMESFAEHRNSLRLLRNAQAHYQETPKKHVQFFDDRARLTWAMTIHRQIAKIFSEYRIGCAVVCMIAGRKGEIDIKSGQYHYMSNISYLRDQS